MNKIHHITLDSLGHIILPEELIKRLGLIAGTEIILEESEDNILFLRIEKETSISETRPIIDKDGILVIQSKLSDDFLSVIEEEHTNRIDELIKRIFQ